jgi:hypothetical protein
MQAILVNLVAAAMLIQSTFGCCRLGLLQFGKDSGNAKVACCAACSQRTQQSHKSDLPCNGKANCKGVCTYVTTVKLQVETSFVMCNLALDQTNLPKLTSPQPSLYSWALDGPNESPPVQLHVLNQIWLI